MYAVDSDGSLILDEVKNDDPDAIKEKYTNLVEFEEKFRNQHDSASYSFTQRAAKAVKSKFCKCNAKKAAMTYFPIIRTLATYDVKEHLPNDVAAGLTSGIMMIPQGMAYAALSTLPPIVGLYISFFASLSYVFVGTGRHLSWGCIAILSLMMASILDKYDSSISGNSDPTACINSSISQLTNIEAVTLSSPGNESDSSNGAIDDAMMRRIELAGGVSVLAGLLLAVASRIGLSHITALMSDSLITGFAVGISCHVITSQVKILLGISVPRFKGPGQLIRTWIAIFEHIDETKIATLVTSVICILVIYVVKRHINERFKSKLRIPIPIELFIVVAGTLASYYGYLNKNYGVAIVEDIPTGVPGPKLPNFPVVIDYIGDAVVIIIISYAQSLAMAKTMALKNNYPIDVPQEMLACGLCSMICGLFSGYVTGASVSRSVVQEGAGGKTQVASLFAALLVFLVIMFIGPYFYYLPKCVLSAIIVANLRSMMLKLLDIPKEWRKSKYDCCVWVFSCVATVLLNADVGLLAGAVFSLLLVVFRSMIHPIEETGQIQTSTATVQLRSLAKYSSARKLDHVKILRVKTPLYFINSEIFSSAILKQMNIDKSRLEHKKEKAFPVDDPSSVNGSASRKDSGQIDNAMHIMSNGEVSESATLVRAKVVVLDMSGVSFIDVMGVKALELLIQQSSKADMALLFTNVPESIFSMLMSTGFWKKHADRLFTTVEDALSSLADAVVAEQSERVSV